MAEFTILNAIAEAESRGADPELRRRDWAVRVLGYYYGPNSQDKRLSAARSIYPSLPESVRAEIGEEP